MFPRTAFVILCLPFLAHAGQAGGCHVGAYRLDSADIVDIATSEHDTLRWRKFDGTTGALHKHEDNTWSSTLGWTDRPDGKTVSFADCASGTIRFDGAMGHRIAFDVTDTTFKGRDVDLAGRLVLPKGRASVPIVILVHGSERDSARDT